MVELSEAVTGLLLTLALGWDLAASGPEITKRDSPHFLRRARVVVYGGHLVLVAV